MALASRLYASLLDYQLHDKPVPPPTNTCYRAALHWLQLASQCITGQPQTNNERIFFGLICGYVFTVSMPTQHSHNSYATQHNTNNPDIYFRLCGDIYIGMGTKVTKDTLAEHQTELNAIQATTTAPTTPIPETPSTTTPAAPEPTTAPTSELIAIEPLTAEPEANLKTSIGFYVKALGFITVEVDPLQYTYHCSQRVVKYGDRPVRNCCPPKAGLESRPSVICHVKQALKGPKHLSVVHDRFREEHSRFWLVGLTFV